MIRSELKRRLEAENERLKREFEQGNFKRIEEQQKEIQRMEEALR